MDIPSSVRWLVLLLCGVLTASQGNFRDFILVADSQTRSIVQLSLEDGSYTHVLQLQGLVNPIAVDYDPINRLVFWTDGLEHLISSANLDGSSQRVVLQMLPTSTPEGLALDPVAELVFYTSNADPFIGVVTYSGTFDKTIITDVKSPRDILTDTTNRKLYWCDYGREMIEKSNYDGSMRETILISPDSWINGLALDLTGNKLYWTDAKSDQVGSIDLRDKIQNIVITAEDIKNALHSPDHPDLDVHFFGVALSKTDLYLTDWSDSKILKVSLADSSVSTYGSNEFGMLSGISIYQYENFRKGTTSSCNNDNGGCSHLCLPLPQSPVDVDHVCRCPENQPLKADRHTCKDLPAHAGPDLLWLESDENFISYIRGISGVPHDFLKTQELSSWTVRSPYWLWSAFDFGYQNSRLFLVDQYDRFVVQLALNNSLDIEVIQKGTSNQVGGIAYDWRSNNVYWTDVLYNWIKVCAAKPENSTHCRTLIETGLDQPHGIAVHPLKGLMFWSDWGEVEKIEVATLAGEDRRVLITQYLNRPKALTIDYKQNRLFWSNTFNIYSSNLDGTRINLVGQGRSDGNFVGITYFNEYVMAVDQQGYNNRPHLWFFNLMTKRPIKMALDRLPTGIVMYHGLRQPLAVDSSGMEIKLDCQRCQHLCVTSVHRPNHTQCLCEDSHTLNDDAQTCTADKSKTLPHYIYALDNSLCILPYDVALAKVEDPSKYCYFKDDKYQFGSLAANTHEGYFYFSEVESSVRSIRRAHVENVQDNTVVVYGVGQVTGIAVDYIVSNLYWTEMTFNSSQGQIWVSRMDGSYQRRLLTAINNPSAIVLNLEHKKMYWVESSPNLPHRIKQANLDGSQVEDFVIAGIVVISGMTYSYHEKRLYWVDIAQHKVSSIMYTGDVASRRDENIPFQSNSRLYDIDFYKDFAVVTDTGTNSSSASMRLYDLNRGRSVGPGFVHKQGVHAYDVIVFAKVNQPLLQASQSGCASSPCDQLCLDLPQGSYVCSCMDGMRLQQKGGSKCVPNLVSSENFLLLTDDYRHTIFSLADADVNKISALSVPQMDRPLAVTYDPVERKIYWSDFQQGFIKRTNIDGDDPVEVVKEYKSTGSRVDGLAFDHIARLLYYSDTQKNEIAIMNPLGTHQKTIVRATSNPRAMVLDQANGNIYYTERQSDRGGIYRASLDGSNPIKLVSTNLSWPSGMDIDFAAGQIYWVDAHTESLESCDLHGNNRKMVYKQNETADPFGVAIVRDYVYWTDWNARGLFRVNKDGSDFKVLGTDFFGGLNDIKYYGNNLRDSTDNPCAVDNGGCSHFCLRRSATEYFCSCPDHDGKSVRTRDGKNCPTVEACLSILPNGMFDFACSFRLGETCKFSCTEGFVYANPSLTEVKCGPGLVWDTSLYSLCKSTRCDMINLPRNVDVVDGCDYLAKVGDVCRVKCKPGYTQDGGDLTRQCRSDLTWSGAEAKCRELPQCRSIDYPPSILISMNCTNMALYSGLACQIMCAPGYQSTGPNTMTTVTCRNDGSWQGPKPTCIQVTSSTTTSPTTSQVGPAVNQASQKKGTSAGVIAGVIVAVGFILIIILAVLLFIFRRNVSLLAKLRGSPAFRRASLDDTRPVLPPKEVSPVYNAKVGRVDLTDSMAFENPGYASLTHGPDSPGNAYEKINPPAFGDLNKAAVEHDNTGFSNPMYGTERKNSVVMDPVALQRQLTGDSNQDSTDA